jgi:hypothetical protein
MPVASERADGAARMLRLRAQQTSLQDSGAAQFDPVTWHYLDLLAQRAEQQQGLAQHMLCDKLEQGLSEIERRFAVAFSTGHQTANAHEGANETATSSQALNAGPSPLAELLQVMKQNQALATPSPSGEWRQENPRIQQFRKQLGRISVQKKITQAIAQAPQNAGPINSHMLVLRSLGIMREVSPDYLNRFMAHLDTLLCLDQAGQVNAKPKAKSASGATPSLKG